MTIEIVDNSPNVTVVVSGSNYYDIIITDASELSMAHVTSTSNPHSVTAAQVGLGNVINAEQLLRSQFETALTHNNGINTARFIDMNIGQPADWEIMRLGA